MVGKKQKNTATKTEVYIDYYRVRCKSGGKQS